MESVARASKDALPRGSDAAAHSLAAAASAAAAAAVASPSSLSAQQPVHDELAVISQRITGVESDIARVEKLLAAAIEKRDSFEDDEKKWERHDRDVARLTKKEEQLREDKTLLLKKEERLEAGQSGAPTTLRPLGQQQYPG
jgi:septal ring factor EnvC (AmiA/AmiB activator)